jgi:hypothetical protein
MRIYVISVQMESLIYHRITGKLDFVLMIPINLYNRKMIQQILSLLIRRHVTRRIIWKDGVMKQSAKDHNIMKLT